MSRWLTALIKITLILITLIPLQAGTSEFSRLWTQVSQAEEKKLPKTAIKILDEILEKSRDLDQRGDYLKALSKKILNEAHILGKHPKDKVRILRERIAASKEEDRSILKAILAIWFWHYHDQNRYKFSRRSTTAGLENQDFSTWDSPRLFAEVDSLFQEALSEREKLRNLNLEDFEPVVEKGSLGYGYCKTLYEFLAREALRFYKHGMQTLPKPQDAFEIEADSDALSSFGKFALYQPKTTDQDSLLLKALTLYQELLSYLKSIENHHAFLDTEIHRLIFFYENSLGSSRKERFTTRLQELVDDFGSSPVSTLAIHQLARLAFEDKDFIKAVRLCSSAISRFPGSDGATLCQNLRNRILTKEYNLRMDHTINASNSTALVEYKNLTTLHLRIVKDRWRRVLEKNWADPDGNLNDVEVQSLLNQEPVARWSINLEETADYKQRSLEITLPPLKHGYYRLLVSHRLDFLKISGNKIVHTGFWSTDTTLMLKRIQSNIQGLLVDSRNGEPLSERTVEIFKRERRGRYRYFTSVATEADGRFLFERPKEQRYGTYLFYARSSTGDVLFHDPMGHSHVRKKHSSRGVLFYTDRSIYRPGQTIRFKGICYEKNPAGQAYGVYACQNVNIRLRDANHQEVERLNLSGNDFGSFSGEFTAPKGKLTGAFTLVASSPSGTARIRVEEYKRPKFEVTLKALEKESRLADRIEVEGVAKSYAGVPIQNATIKYRVLRTTRMPWWWRWYNPYQGAREIASGKGKTDDNGEFKVPFDALPDRTVDKKIDPSFNFEVQVDVIDPTGETRSASRSVRIGYSAMEARLSAPTWLLAEEEIPLSLTTKTLDGKPVDNQGNLEIYALREPPQPERKPSRPLNRWWGGSTQANSGKKDLSNFKNWELGDEVRSLSYKTSQGAKKITLRLRPGAYRAKLKTKDKFGIEVKSEISFLVFSGSVKQFPVKVPSFFQLKSASLEPGDELQAVWGTGYASGRAFVSFIHDGKVLKSYWSNPGESLHSIRFPIDRSLRGGLTLQVYFVQENQIYSYTRFIQVSYPEKQLKVRFQTFRDKLRPNEKEVWSLILEGKDARKLATEMVATLYDESLDAFYAHSFRGLSHLFWRDSQAAAYQVNLYSKTLMNWWSSFGLGAEHISRTYPSFPWWLKGSFSYLFPPMYRGGRFMSKSMARSPGVLMESDKFMDEEKASEGFGLAQAAPANRKKKSRRREQRKDSKAGSKSEPSEPKFVPRSNLSETAFFFPHLISDEEGKVEIRFQMPEALTRWKFLAMAHGKGLEWGQITRSIVTQKELMMQPHLPRFLRQGDRVVLTSKVSNLSTSRLEGNATLRLANALTGEDVSGLFFDLKPVGFQVGTGKSQVVSFEITVPDITYPLQVRMVAKTATHADGEEGVLPVISRTVLVREAKPLWVRGPGERSVKFHSLLSSASEGVIHEKLVLQMASHPAWYAVQALPYLATYPHACTDQVFNRLYANSLGQFIANSQPRIQQIFKLWKGSDALESNLQKNEDLKSVLLEETPWVLEAQSESAAKKRVGNFFDINRMNSEIQDTLAELKSRMLPDGGWPWFPGGKRSDFITLYIVTGLGRLRHLGVKMPVDMALLSAHALDLWIKKIYDQIMKHSDPEHNHYSNLIAYYLYGRSFFLEEKPIESSSQRAVEYFLGQAEQYWTGLDNRMGEGHTALGLLRFGRSSTPKEVMASLRERALHDEEMGMYWGDEEFAYWWYRAPIETQAMMVEAFQELSGSEEEIESLKVWLLKQKQTQDWKTNKATADAIYALLLRGADLLSGTKLVKVWVGSEEVRPEKVEAGTGFYEKRWSPSEIRAEQGKIRILKEEKGIAWGGLHWQYFQELSKIKAQSGNLGLKKHLFVRKNTKKGPVILPIKDQRLELGDTLVVRVVLRADRDFEYVHMKDGRGSGTEPVNVLSRYKYQDGLAYYEATKDTATHFYFDYLPKGTYVFEYDLKVFHRGQYTSGIAEIECLYAPEFRAHSEAHELEVD
jgi:uncharacterized protein YfaS (alpha-2-macroglobulin family)